MANTAQYSSSSLIHPPPPPPPEGPPPLPSLADVSHLHDPPLQLQQQQQRDNRVFEQMVVQPRRKTVIVISWGTLPIGIDRGCYVPHGFRCITHCSGRNFIGETSVSGPSNKVYYRFIDRDTGTIGSWATSPCHALNNVNDAVHNDKHYRGTNARLVVGVTYPNLQVRIMQAFGLQPLAPIRYFPSGGSSGDEDENSRSSVPPPPPPSLPGSMEHSVQGAAPRGASRRKGSRGGASKHGGRSSPSNVNVSQDDASAALGMLLLAKKSSNGGGSTPSGQGDIQVLSVRDLPNKVAHIGPGSAASVLSDGELGGGRADNSSNARNVQLAWPVGTEANEPLLGEEDSITPQEQRQEQQEHVSSVERVEQNVPPMMENVSVPLVMVDDNANAKDEEEGEGEIVASLDIGNRHHNDHPHHHHHHHDHHPITTDFPPPPPPSFADHHHQPSPSGNVNMDINPGALDDFVAVWNDTDDTPAASSTSGLNVVGGPSPIMNSLGTGLESGSIQDDPLNHAHKRTRLLDD